MSDPYREYLRKEYKNCKQSLMKDGKESSKKHVYAELRRRYYSSNHKKSEPIKQVEPTVAVTPSKAKVKESPKFNLKNVHNFLLNVTKFKKK